MEELKRSTLLYTESERMSYIRGVFIDFRNEVSVCQAYGYLPSFADSLA